MNITIRLANPEDAIDVASVYISSWKTTYKGIISDRYLDWLTPEKRVEQYKKDFEEHKEYTSYCIVVEDKIVGLLVIGQSHDEDKLEAGEIQALYLIKEYSRKGIGRFAVEFAIKTLQNEGFKEIILWVLEENKKWGLALMDPEKNSRLLTQSLS